MWPDNASSYGRAVQQPAALIASNVRAESEEVVPVNESIMVLLSGVTVGR